MNHDTVTTSSTPNNILSFKPNETMIEHPQTTNSTVAMYPYLKAMRELCDNLGLPPHYQDKILQTFLDATNSLDSHYLANEDTLRGELDKVLSDNRALTVRCNRLEKTVHEISEMSYERNRHHSHQFPSERA